MCAFPGDAGEDGDNDARNQPPRDFEPVVVRPIWAIGSLRIAGPIFPGDEEY